MTDSKENEHATKHSPLTYYAGITEPGGSVIRDVWPSVAFVDSIRGENEEEGLYYAWLDN